MACNFDLIFLQASSVKTRFSSSVLINRCIEMLNQTKITSLEADKTRRKAHMNDAIVWWFFLTSCSGQTNILGLLDKRFFSFLVVRKINTILLY
jgi:hypothetical protein